MRTALVAICLVEISFCPYGVKAWALTKEKSQFDSCLQGCPQARAGHLFTGILPLLH